MKGMRASSERQSHALQDRIQRPPSCCVRLHSDEGGDYRSLAAPGLRSHGPSQMTSQSRTRLFEPRSRSPLLILRSMPRQVRALTVSRIRPLSSTTARGSSLSFASSSGVERAIATALLELVDRSSGGWATANYYWVRYLPAHLEFGLNLDGLVALTTNPGWLRRAIDLLGVDRTVNSIAGGGVCLSPVAYVVQKALRRCRIALSRDPGQLAGQMQARLRNNSDARLAGLGDALAAESPDATLQMRHGALDWMADLEYDLWSSRESPRLGFRASRR